MTLRLRLILLVSLVGTLPQVCHAVDFLKEVKPILQRKCLACHGALKQEGGLRLDAVSLALQGGDTGPSIEPGCAATSLLWERLTAEDASYRMPPETTALTSEQLQLIRDWIDQGALPPVDDLPQPSPRDHWAFRPLSQSPPPNSRDHHPIDAFIRNKLASAGLVPNATAGASTVVRRAYFDLIGLPPTPEELLHWQTLLGIDPGAMTKLIDHLLASPRYGERWAQPWLDAIRYADTHGFEVNTPRPNAWHYRDYVIRSLNSDIPYDRFVTEQLAGDAFGEDAATGFLVAAPVLLPGQIGKDDASIRLARQDALDEIIAGTASTLLGLTIHCTRCHDHKFDPFTQEDYYAIQAFFAGVEYGDRDLRDDQFHRQQSELQEIELEMRSLENELAAYQPQAAVQQTILIDDADSERTAHLDTKKGHGLNPDGTQRGYKHDAGDGQRIANISRGSYTWWANVSGHDVFTWNPNASGRFHLWISWGTHGSGVHTRDARYILDWDGDLETKDDQRQLAAIDQFYFAGQESGESEKKPLWSGLLYVGEHDWQRSSRLVLRGGDSGTGITADVIVLQACDGLPPIKVAGTEQLLPRLRSPVNAKQNSEQIEPVSVRFVRFESFGTIDFDRHEPCLDELELFGTGSNNLALATAGVQPSSSGNIAESGIHQLKHINDGRYGNSASWISNQHGRGWVQLELPEPQTLTRVVWSRDRQGKYVDRLPIEYEVSVSSDGQRWQKVAGSQDRAPHASPWDELQSLMRSAIGTSSEVEQRIANAAGRLEKLMARHKVLATPRQVYAGTFREPDKTRVLRRGDPEQPLEVIAPRVPQVFGGTAWPAEADEQARRLALAEWISDGRNPLTARVIVNRIWQHHFGLGIVETPSDFGMAGAPPSHPELLDWLARELVRHDWSIKWLHRIIMESETYQQSSHIDVANQMVDAQNKLLWRFRSRRLTAESIRDSMLAISGRLNLTMGGAGFDFFQSRGGLSGFPPVNDFPADGHRRMIYAHKVRMEQVPVFGAFDCPDAGQAAPRRGESTTALQSLNLFNSEFVLEQSDAFRARVIAEAGADEDRQVKLAFQLALGREPSDEERLISLRLVQQHGLVMLCRVLFNTNEFLFLP